MKKRMKMRTAQGNSIARESLGPKNGIPFGGNEGLEVLPPEVLDDPLAIIPYYEMQKNRKSGIGNYFSRFERLLRTRSRATKKTKINGIIGNTVVPIPEGAAASWKVTTEALLNEP